MSKMGILAMRTTRVIRLMAATAAAVLLGACAATDTAPIQAMNSAGADLMKTADPAEPQVYRFYPGDELSVRAVNRPELTIASLRVDPYGYIAYPYLGQVQVKNLTPQEVAERLAGGLQEKDFYRRVELGVSFLGSKEQFVYVLGEVKKPGPIAINGSIRLLDAIGLAGGQTYDSEMSTVLWIRGRQTPPGVVKVNLASFGDPRAADPKLANLTVIPGDVIYIPDSVIASVQRFANRMFDILRPLVLLENGIILFDSAELVLRGAYPRATNTNNTNTIIITPLNP